MIWKIILIISIISIGLIVTDENVKILWKQIKLMHKIKKQLKIENYIKDDNAKRME